MNDKIMLGDFIFRLRKEKNLSQAELGDMVGVSNKAVSKWETYEANPDLQIIPKLAKALDVTTDELLACKKAEAKKEFGQESSLFGIKGTTDYGNGFYEFVSERKTAKGKPYVHINFGKDKDGKMRKANGVLAVGFLAKGIVSIGLVSVGILSIGFVTLGLLTIGFLCLGLFAAVGAVAVSAGVSIGGIAIGTIAIGGIAFGIFSFGGISIGVWAQTGELGKAIGIYTQYYPRRYPFHKLSL